MEFLDDFQVQGPNGTHQSEKLGPSLSTDIEDAYGEEQFPTGVAKYLVAKVFHGVAFLHSSGVIHGGNSIHSALWASLWHRSPPVHTYRHASRKRALTHSRD